MVSNDDYNNLKYTNIDIAGTEILKANKIEYKRDIIIDKLGSKRNIFIKGIYSNEKLDGYIIMLEKQAMNVKLTIIIIWLAVLLAILIAGVIVKDSRPDVKATYTKYFGNDYKIEYDTNYSMIISNHTSFLDTLLGMRSYGAGYIAKASVKNTPFVGPCAVRFQSLFVDRENSKDRQTVLNQIKERQEGMLSGTNPTPIIIYPEGTTTSGGHLLKFKRGAFNALLPLKPVMVKGNGDASYHVGCGNSDVMINYMRGFTKLFYVVEYIELPIMRPTEYMYEKYKHLGIDKVEVYSEVAREIYCEAGGFKKGNGSLRETNRYSMIMEKNKYISKEE
jgi:1-acyl-sn-glycerol-3-phosphate acyltransferase